MRKLAYLALIMFCVCLGLMLVTMMDYLVSYQGLSKVQQEQLVHGQIESWVLSEALLSRYPALSPLTQVRELYSGKALLMTVPLFFVGYYVLRLRGKYSLFTVGLVCLGAGVIPYAAGRLALLYNTDITNSGPWVALMLLGVFYAAAGCLFFATLGLLFSNVGSGKIHTSAKAKKRQAIAASL